MLFEWHARQVPGFSARTVRGRRRVYTLPVMVERYGDVRHVEIVFEGYVQVPAVTVEGPTDSPHRYSDGSLCMWRPSDPPELRWVFRDGLLALIGHIRLHLFREAYWREFDVWPGPEAPHGPGKEPPEEQAA